MEYKSLKDIATITMGQSPESSSYNEERNGIPFYQGNADFGELYPTVRVWCNNPKKTAKENDILISVRAPIGALNYATEKCCIGRGLAAITIENDFERNYVFHLLKAQKNKLNNKGTGSTFKAIGKSVLEEIQVPVISIEQQEISMKLMDTIEQIVRHRKQELKSLDTLIKSRFTEMFGDPVENPKGYYVATLQELINNGFIMYHLDGNHGGDYPRSEEFVDSGVPYISANCIVNDEIDFSKAKFLTPERAGKLRKGIAQDDDVLFAHNATVGPTVVLHTDEEKVILGTSLTAYRCNKEEIMPNYLKAYMLSDGFVRQYSGDMKQTTRNQVPITAQKKYLFLIPPIEEQNQFSAFVAQIDKLKALFLKLPVFPGLSVVKYTY